MSVRNAQIIPIEQDLTRFFADLALTLPFIIIFIAIFLSAVRSYIAGYIAVAIVLLLAVPPLFRALTIVRSNKIVREFSSRIESFGLTVFPGERLELYTVSIEGVIIGGSYVTIGIGTSGRTAGRKRYVNIKRFERSGEVAVGYDLARLGADGMLAVFPTGEGVLYGRGLRIDGGRYDDIVVIPIFPRIDDRVVEERVEGDGESCSYRLELRECVLRGEIGVLASRRARSYRVEAKVVGEIGEIPSEFSSVLYSGGPGSFETDVFICRPLILVARAKTIDMRDIAEKVRLALDGGETLFMGYREKRYKLRLIIDRPMAKDLVKEILI